MLQFAVVCGNHFVMKIENPIILDGNLTFSPYDEKDWRCLYGAQNFDC